MQVSVCMPRDGVGNIYGSHTSFFYGSLMNYFVMVL